MAKEIFFIVKNVNETSKWVDSALPVKNGIH